MRFLKMVAMTITIVSANSAGNEGNHVSHIVSPGGDSVSADGRYVAFYSFAANLVAGSGARCARGKTVASSATGESRLNEASKRRGVEHHPRRDGSQFG